MKDLIKEGRDLQEKFVSSLNENDADFISTSSDYRVVQDNENLVIAIPRNYNAVREILDDTKWAQTFTTASFNRYQKQRYTIYFIVLKKGSPKYNNNNYKKMAVLISPSGEFTCYDSTASLIDITNIITITGMARNIFKQIK